MKKTIYIPVLVAALFVVVFSVFIFLRGGQRDSSEPDRPAVPVDNRLEEPVGSAVQPETAEENPGGIPPEMARLMAEKILSAMTGGGGAVLEGGEFDASALWDSTVSLKIRRQIAWELAHSDDPAYFRVLTEYLNSSEGDLQMKAWILESLGESPNPEARDWILSALDASEETLVCGALKGLAKLDNPSDVGLFSALLLSGATPSSIRVQAALALGVLSAPEAAEVLISAYRATPEDDALRTILIQGLGQRDIAETEVFFRQLLSSETEPDRRLEVVQAVSDAKGDTAPFLLHCMDDEDGEVRAEAAWAMSLLNGDHGGELCDLLRDEPDSEVRQRLYEALDGQDNIDVPLVLKSSLQEEDAEARIAAYTLVATSLDKIEDAAEREGAEAVLVNEFERMAVESKTLNQQLRAVIGLRRMGGDDASAALRRIVGQSTDPRVISATGIDLTEMTGKQ